MIIVKHCPLQIKVEEPFLNILCMGTLVSHGPYPYIYDIPVSTDGQLMVADTAGLVADT